MYNFKRRIHVFFLKEYWAEVAAVIVLSVLTLGNLYFYGEKNLALTLKHATEIGSFYK